MPFAEVTVNNADEVGPWVRRFLLEHVVQERNLARNTQRSYRDAFLLFLPFAAKHRRRPLERLSLSDLSPEVVRAFLQHLERARSCGSASLNQRLAALHAWARFVGSRSPEHLEWSGRIRGVCFRKSAAPLLAYLEKAEIQALIEAPNSARIQGRRDHALLLFLYNTGARASEAAQLRIGDVDFATPAVTLHGKGGKDRRCPLWPKTSVLLEDLAKTRPATDPVFRNHRGQALTRFGIHTLVERCTREAFRQAPSLKTKRVSPHTIRHTTAMHLLQAGVDMHTIRSWLGHVSLQTTRIYAESDLKMKAKALAKCEASLEPGPRIHSRPQGVVGFLKSI